jgi:hypothetical protein
MAYQKLTFFIKVQLVAFQILASSIITSTFLSWIFPHSASSTTQQVADATPYSWQFVFMDIISPIAVIIELFLNRQPFLLFHLTFVVVYYCAYVLCLYLYQSQSQHSPMYSLFDTTNESIKIAAYICIICSAVVTYIFMYLLIRLREFLEPSGNNVDIVYANGSNNNGGQLIGNSDAFQSLPIAATDSSGKDNTTSGGKYINPSNMPLIELYNMNDDDEETVSCMC